MRPVASKEVGSNRITGEGNEVLNWKLWWISNFGTLQKKQRERETQPPKKKGSTEKIPLEIIIYSTSRGIRVRGKNPNKEENQVIYSIFDLVFLTKPRTRQKVSVRKRETGKKLLRAVRKLLLEKLLQSRPRLSVENKGKKRGEEKLT